MTAAHTRRVYFLPGYDKRATGYGIHGMHIEFALIGPAGATSFALNTGWVPGVPTPPETADLWPMAWDLGHHWRTPTSPEEITYECALVEGGTCYYDGSSLRAEPLLKAFLAEGEDPVWEALESEYSYWAEHGDDWRTETVAGS